jgi:hypothetical protein
LRFIFAVGMSEIWAEIDWWEAALFALLLVLAVAGSWVMRRVLRAQLQRAREAGRSLLRIEVLKSLVPLMQWGLVIAAVAFGLHQFKVPPTVAFWLDAGLKAAFTLLAAAVAGSAVSVSLQHWASTARDPGGTDAGHFGPGDEQDLPHFLLHPRVPPDPAE